MRITNKLPIRQYVANEAFFPDMLHLCGFIFMKATIVEGFLIKQAQNRLFLTIK
jgi:hypothetical protein